MQGPMICTCVCFPLPCPALPCPALPCIALLTGTQVCSALMSPLLPCQLECAWKVSGGSKNLGAECEVGGHKVQTR